MLRFDQYPVLAVDFQFWKQEKKKQTLHEITCHCNVWLPASAALIAMEEEWLENFGWNEPQNPLFHTTLKCNIFCKHSDSSLDDP